MQNGPLRVLLVEDSSLLAGRLSELINRLPDIDLIDTVDTEAQALTSIAASNPDVLILDVHLRHGSGFAFAVSGVMLSEQTLLNAAVLTVDITSVNVALAGIVFNVLLIARAPLQLFQAIQTSLLPHLTGLEATEGHDAFAHAIRVTVRAITAFAAAVAPPVRMETSEEEPCRPKH